MSESNKKQSVKKGFKGFLARFPNETLPVILAHGDQNPYSRKNKPLSPELALAFMWQEGDEDFSEFIEFVPCFRLPEMEKFHGLIYWQGDLLNYHFYLAVFDKKGEILKKVQIAGTKVNGEVLEVSVAKIEVNWNIEIQSGSLSVHQRDLSKAILDHSSLLSIDPSSGEILIQTLT